MAKIRAQAGQWNSCIEFMMKGEQENEFATDIIYSELPKGRIIEPLFRLDYNDAQSLIDDLWQAGLRPSEGTGSAGSLKATENHLKDMQKIAFKLLGDEIK
jgi:hypothetical protein